MSNLQLHRVDFNGMEQLGRLQKILGGLERPYIVIVIDKKGEVVCGDLEKVLYESAGTKEKDLCVRTHKSGYLFDHEISELYIIG